MADASRSILSPRCWQSESDLIATFWSRTRVAEIRSPNQGEADPDARAEVERHPGDLALPIVPVAGDHPAQRGVAQALGGREIATAVVGVHPVARHVHGHFDREHEHEVRGEEEERSSRSE